MRARERRLFGCGGLVCLGVVAMLMTAAIPVRAATINLQESHEWYGQGKTVVHGVYAGDTDMDSSTEIVTVGEVYLGDWVGTKAQMKIWGWDSQTQAFVVEKTKEWRPSGDTAVALSVYVGDVDDDDANEIVTVGYGTSSGSYYNEFTIWEYVQNDYTAVQDIGYTTGRMFNSVYATQIDTSDNYYEIVVAGVDLGGLATQAKLLMFTYDGDSTSLKASTSWYPNQKSADAKGVYAKDVDGDGTVEILTAGYIHDSSNVQLAEVRAWYYSSGNLNLEDIDGYTWNAGKDHAEALSVFAADVGDGSDIEITTCGNAVDGNDHVWGDLETFTLSGSVISWDRNAVWQYSNADTECHSVYVGDLDGTTPLDIVTVGKAAVLGTDYGEMKVWNYRGSPNNDIYAIDSYEWYTDDDTEAHSVFMGDVDSDSTVEMVSGGQAYDGTRIRAQMRVWYLS